MRACVRVLAVTEWKLTPFSAAGAERVGVKVEDVETLKNTPGAPETASGSVMDEHFYPNRKSTSASDNARLRSSAAIFPPGILLRSSVWLALPDLMDSISAANGTAAWPEVYCVGSAVRTGAC